MVYEENIVQQENKNKGLLIGCGCFLSAIVAGLIIIGVIVVVAVNAVKSAVKPDIDAFFEKYNEKNMAYICENLFSPEISNTECINAMNKMYKDLGKELDYNMSILKGANIDISHKNNVTRKVIKTTGDFEKLSDVSLNFEMYIDKSRKTKMNYFRYKKD